MKIVNSSISAVLLLAVLLSSCSSKQTVTIQGSPGEEIYSSLAGGRLLGQIPASGQLKVTLQDENYQPFLLSKKPGENYFVPFALNSKNRSTAGAQFSEGLGYTFAGIGLVGMLTGTIGACIHDDALAAIGVGGGAALVGLGAAMGAPAGSRLTQGCYENQIRYLSNQETNGNIKVTQPVFETPTVKTQKAPKKTQETQTNVDVAKPNKKTETAKRTLKDLAKQVAFTYNGSGTLSENKSVIENYADITLVITRVSSDEVSVKVIENGEDFFGNPAIYTVSKKGNNFVLTHKNIYQATITITPKGKLTYIHPRVKIDDAVYNLSITATRQ